MNKLLMLAVLASCASKEKTPEPGEIEVVVPESRQNRSDFQFGSNWIIDFNRSYSVEQLNKFNIVWVDADDYSKKEVSQLKNAHSYVSIGSAEKYRKDWSQLKRFCKKDMKGYDDECWLDLEQYPKFLQLMKNRIANIANLGFKGLYFDNTDVMNHTGVSKDINQAYLKALLDYGKSLGLHMGYNNGLEFLGQIRASYHINEQCHQYNECDKYSQVTDVPVFNYEFKKRHCPKKKYAKNFSTHCHTRESLNNKYLWRKL